MRNFLWLLALSVLLSACGGGGNSPMGSFSTRSGQPEIVETTASSTSGYSVPQTGVWWNPSASGSGYGVDVQGSQLSLTLYMYETSGRAIWYAGILSQQTDGSYSGSISSYAGGQSLGGTYQAPTANTTIGSAWLGFTSATQGTLTVTPSGSSTAVSVPLQRYGFQNNTLGAASSLLQNGVWWAPDQSGRGYFIEAQGNLVSIGSYMYDTSGQPVWYTALATLNGSSASGLLYQYGNGQTLTGSYRSPSVVNTFGAGMTFTATSATTGNLTLPNGSVIALKRFVFSSSAASGVSGVSITATPTTAYVGQSINLTGVAYDASNLAMTYQWNFGDGTTGSGANVTHTYTTPGTYTVSLTVRDSAGASASSSTALSVLASSSGNSLTVDCSGINCGAQSPSLYSGSGVGAWKFVNTNSTPALLNINIAGVQAGQKATLVFANTGVTTAAQSPSTGTLASPVAANSGESTALRSTESLGDSSTEASAHDRLLIRNRQAADFLLSVPKRSMSDLDAKLGTGAPNPTPGLGTVRVWNDLYNSPTAPVPYATSVAATCVLPSGRSIVFWVDPNASISGKVTSTDLGIMQASVCGPSGGFDRLNQLLGDVWGSAAAPYAGYLIQDGSALQDIHVVIVNVPSSTGWAGYFSTISAYLPTTASWAVNSNQALAFFVNANTVKNNRPYAVSTLLHEATHMTNFYQRLVKRGSYHDTWLEESSAMMTEDIVGPVVNAGYNSAVSSRIPGYLSTGGGVSYINWPNLSAGNYSIGGSFGAYLTRRYGLSIYQQLITSCNDGTTIVNGSYYCLDNLIKANGGLGYADEFAHFGAAMFAALPLSKALDRYSLPARTDAGYTFAAIDVSLTSGYMPLQPTAIGASGFTATSHYYTMDTIGPGKTSYVRNNVSVPAGSTLLLVIR
ncbi:M30 family zinc metallopeptidase [Curvibacter gracilis]|uniref:M30 family zinc metallopeptidase n=1 Tax=Curvibacter gracilis TaxID=230310 RepID=UPI0009FC6A44|nr:PKD domain-containing protein [Curvibacter gracilis]